MIGTLLLPVVLKKELQEIKMMSYMLFLSVSLFILLMSYQLLTDGDKFNPDPAPYNYWDIKWSLNMVSGISVILTANNYSFAEFPLYRALGQDRSSEKMIKAVGLGVF